MEPIEVLLRGLASGLNLDATEFIAELKDGDKWLEGAALTDKVVSNMTAQIKSAKDEQRKRGQREMGETLERHLSGLGFENTEKLKGPKLVDAFIEWKESNIPNPVDDPAKLSKEVLAKLPQVKDLVQEKLTQAHQKFTDLESEFSNYKKQESVKQVRSVAESAMASILKAKGAVLESKATGVTEQQRLTALARLLDWTKVGLSQDGKPIILGDDGEEAKDEWGKPLTFENYVVDLNKGVFGFNTQDPNRGGGDPPPGGGGQGAGAKMRFNTEADFTKYISNEPDAAKRQQAMEAYAEQVAEK